VPFAVDRLLHPFLAAAFLLGALPNLFPYLSFDAAAYYYEALRVVQGHLPYRGFVENKSPGIFGLLALPALVSGWNPIGALLLWRALEAIWLLLLWRLLGRITPERLPRSIALLAVWGAYLAAFSGTHESIYVELPETVCVTAAGLLALDRRSLAAGICCGLAALFRQTALVHLLPVAALSIVHPIPPKDRVLAVARMALGTAVVGLAVVLLAAAQGWLEPWWYQAYDWNYRYMAAYGSPWERLRSLLGHLFTNDFGAPFGIGLLLWSVAVVSDVRAGRIHRYPLHLLLALATGAGWVEASASGNLFRHHFIPWYPALAAVLAAGLDHQLSIWRRTHRRMPVASLLFAGAIVLVVIVAALRESAIFHRTDRQEVAEIAAWVRERTAPDDTILVWGFVPQIYLEARRHAASAHLHNLLLTNVREKYLPLDERFLAQFDEDMRRNRPKLILLFGRERIGRYSAFVEQRYREGIFDTAAGPIRYLEAVQTDPP
jgi:hypothetical protein